MIDTRYQRQCGLSEPLRGDWGGETNETLFRVLI